MFDHYEKVQIIVILCVSVWLFFGIMIVQWILDSTVVIHPTSVAAGIGIIALMLIGAVKLRAG